MREVESGVDVLALMEAPDMELNVVVDVCAEEEEEGSSRRGGSGRM